MRLYVKEKVNDLVDLIFEFKVIIKDVVDKNLVMMLGYIYF